MTVVDLENTNDATTEHWATTRTESDQRNPVTRRVAFEAYIGELETRSIERNSEFHATIVKRLQTPANGLIDADSVLAD